jgi:SAM-dependent methyltransferase
MERTYTEIYRDLYFRHWWWRAREEFLVAILRRYLPRKPQRHLLDIGCGAGQFFERLAEFGSVEGIEPDTSLQTGRSDVDDRIHWGTLQTFRPNRRFSAVLLLDVLEHVPDPILTMTTAAGLLEPGGVIIATVPAFPVLWTRHDELNNHLVRYTKQTLAEVAHQAGCDINLLRYFFHWTFPAKLVVRMREQWFGGGVDESVIPHVPSAKINRALYLFSRAEQVCTASVSLPFGSSLLFVGRATP